MTNIDQSPRPASGALTKTSGFLKGFTHTLQPYIGCRFGCEYCYVKGLSVHRFHQPTAEWGDYAHPRVGIAEKLRAELQRHQRKGRLDDLAIFMSSATDPYQGLERKWRLSRACLDLFREYPPKLLIVQTRSPLVVDDLDRIHALNDAQQAIGGQCWLNFTLETDLDEVRKVVTPTCPSIPQRLKALKQAQAAGVNVQITVSPCLPYSSVETFGQLLLDHGDRVIVDSYASGDGQGGKRTARTGVPRLYERLGWGDWDSEREARRLLSWLHEVSGGKVNWSQAGFTQFT